VPVAAETSDMKACLRNPKKVAAGLAGHLALSLHLHPA
jgi:hypothetical protein